MEVFGKKDPLRANFHKCFPIALTRTRKHVFLCKFREIGRPEVGEIARRLMDQKNKISAPPPAAASARIAPKICQGQLQTLDSEFPKFHPNPFTSGGVIDERVNIVQTCHKVFAILGEASASSPCNKRNTANSLPLYIVNTDMREMHLHCTRMFIITARRSYASAVLGVVILSICPSVTRVLCD